MDTENLSNRIQPKPVGRAPGRMALCTMLCLFLAAVFFVSSEAFWMRGPLSEMPGAYGLSDMFLSLAKFNALLAVIFLMLTFLSTVHGHM